MQGLNLTSPPGRFHPQPAKTSPMCAAHRFCGGSVLLFSEVENWSGAEPVKASETSDCNSMSGQGVWNRGDGRSERKNNCSHMQNNLLPGEIPKPYPLILGSGGWSEDQGLGLLSSHLCSFQVPPCSL